MSLLDRVFARKPLPQPQAATDQRNQVRLDASRRELLSMAVNDTLKKNSIPKTWITAEASPTLTARKERGLHLRLVVREWQPTLLEYGFALQKLIKAHMTRLDPLSPQWITGISWKFELVDETNCPTMPAPTYWQAVAAHSAAQAQRTRKAAESRVALERLIEGGDRRRSQSPEQDGWAPTQPMVN
jgi:hypothetical protein